MLTIKKIADLVNEIGATIHYYVFNKSANYNYIFYLKAISDSNKGTYESLSDIDKQKYISTSAQLYMPKLSVDGCARVYQDGTYEYEYTLDRVCKIIQPSKEDFNTAIILYMILHEFGHWNDFLLKDKKVYSYSMADYKQAKEVWDYKVKVQRELAFKTSYGKKDLEMLKNYTIKYNSVPSEQRANNYADENYDKAFSILRKEGIVHSCSN